MKYIIQIGKLYDDYHNMNFGYIGKDLDTGKIHYYSVYDSQDNYSPDNIVEFDMENQNSWGEQLRRNLCHCSYQKGEKYPSEIVSLTSEMINKHMIYNQPKEYPIKSLEDNSKHLSFQYVRNFSLLLSDLEFSGRYIPVQNVIEIPITTSDWKNYSNQERKYIEDVLLHEVGHLKVSSNILDMKNKELKVRTGFYRSIVKVNPVVLSNKDVFLEFDKTIDLCKSGTDKILEEVMNDFDCQQIDASFTSEYPNVGHILNELCDGRLETARYYDNGIEELYNSLHRVIEGRDMVDELLESIITTTKSYECNYEENKNYMMKLLKRYQQAKRFR